MAVTKTGDFSVANTSGVVTTTTFRDAIQTLYDSFGIAPFAVGLKSGNPCIVFALQFSGATRGTVYQEFVLSISAITITVTQTIFTTYDPLLFTGTGPGPAQSFTVTTAQIERKIFAYVKPDEIFLLATRSPSTNNNYLGVCSPFTKPTWWNENTFAHVFSMSANGASDLPDFRGIYRGIDPNFFNPFPNTTAASANNVTCSLSDLIGWVKNPVGFYDVLVQPVLRWTGVANYGWVGRFSFDIGITAAQSLQQEQRIALGETEEYETITVSGTRSFVLRLI